MYVDVLHALVIAMSLLRYNRFYYNPLPKNVRIEESSIHGHGIFAEEDIEAETDLGSMQTVI